MYMINIRVCSSKRIISEELLVDKFNMRDITDIIQLFNCSIARNDH